MLDVRNLMTWLLVKYVKYIFMSYKFLFISLIQNIFKIIQYTNMLDSKLVVQLRYFVFY